MRYYLYILRSEARGKYYIGVSNNVARRVLEHNSGFSRSTKPYRPFALVRVEGYKSINEAYSRECFLKSKRSTKIIDIVVKSSPDVLAEQEVGIPISHSEHRDSVGRARHW